MKRLSILLSLLLLAIANPSFAVEARSCEAQAAHMKGAERDNFLKSCVAKLSDPAHVKEVEQKHKKATCEQNAKNKKLPSSKKGDYVDECLNKNEAAIAAAATPQVAQASAKPTASTEAKASTRRAAKQKKRNKKAKSGSQENLK